LYVATIGTQQVGAAVVTHTVTAMRIAIALFITSNMYLSEQLVGEPCGGGHNAK
jgi:hypothetical protein